MTDAATADAALCAELHEAHPPAPSRHFTLAELHKSRLNVRTNAEDAEATAALEESIFNRGLLEPLVVHAVDYPDPPTPWGVLAGGRRLLAITRLIAAGRLPADWPIPASIFAGSDAELIEMSLGENLLRRSLRDYEVHVAIKRAVDQGEDIAEVARSIGQEIWWVKRNLRLGNLAEPIFAAYAAGTLGKEQAAAYAATEDAALQLLVFEGLRRGPDYLHTPARIRAGLKVGDGEAARLLLFVGEAVYLGRGGVIERDLFDDNPHARVRIANEELLRTLAEERLAVERERIRAEASRTDLRFAAAPPQFGGRTDEALEIRVATNKLPVHRYPTDAIVATIDIDHDGQPFTRIWWASRAAKGAAEKAVGKTTPNLPPAAVGADVKAAEAIAMPDSGYAQHGRAIVRDEYGLSADGLQLIRSLRRTFLRKLLLGKAASEGGHVARDYLIWAQARALIPGLRGAISSDTGMRHIIGEWHDSAGDREPADLWQDFAADLPGDRDWRTEVDLVRSLDFMTEPDSAQSLRLFLDADDQLKDGVAAVVVGFALLRSADTPGWRIAVHDVVAQACGANAPQLRRWWHPTAKWMGLFGRMFRLAAAEPLVDAATRAGWSRLKDGDIATAAAIALDPDSHSDPGARYHASRWLPDLLAFGPDAALPLDALGDSIAEQRAAEADPVADQREKVKRKLRGRANPAKVREAVS